MTAGATDPDVNVREVVVRHCADLVGARPSTSSLAWAGAVDTELADVAARDLSTACVLWRALSNAVRLDGQANHRDRLAAIAGGELCVTAFQPERTTITSAGDGYRVKARGLMVTGLAYASNVLIEGRVDDDDATSVFVLAVRDIVRVVRPPLAGLTAADNAVVTTDSIVARSRMVGRRGSGANVVAAPYRAGLTFGSVAVGAASSAVRLTSGLVPPGHRLEADLGSACAAAIAARAATAACAAAAGHADHLSRAAKVAAVDAALRLATVGVEAAGARAYSRDFPLTELRDGIVGLTFQAPTHAGSLPALARTFLTGGDDVRRQASR